MAIIKTGDNQPILECYGDDDVERCLKCGEKLTTLVMDSDDNKLICINCDSEGIEQ